MRYSNTGEQYRWGGVILIQRSSIAGVCYSNTEEQHRWMCVILIKGSSIAGGVILFQRITSSGSVLFKYRGAASLEVCYSNAGGQYCWGVLF